MVALWCLWWPSLLLLFYLASRYSHNHKMVTVPSPWSKKAKRWKNKGKTKRCLLGGFLICRFKYAACHCTLSLHWDIPSLQNKSSVGKLSLYRAVFLMCSIRSRRRRKLGVKNHASEIILSHWVREASSHVRFSTRGMRKCMRWSFYSLSCTLLYTIFLTSSGERERIPVDQVATWSTKQNVTASHTTGPWLSLCVVGPHPALSIDVREPQCSLEPFHSLLHISLLLHCLEGPLASLVAVSGVQALGPPCSWYFWVLRQLIPSFFLFPTIAPAPCPQLSDSMYRMYLVNCSSYGSKSWL